MEAIKPGQHIVIVGTSGSGKTTLARQLVARLNLKHIELDALYWGPDWTPASVEVFRSRVRGAVAEDRWIVDGNYSAIRDLVWQRADMVIWLDFSLAQVMWRICKRTVWRALTRQELWNGNREPVARFFSRDSIILWALNTYHRRRGEFPALMARPEYAHIRFLRFASPKAASDWLETIARPTHESQR